MAGEYRLLRKLGEGGFGAVYEAEHPLLKRRAAVKVLHRVADKDSEAVLRFISEAQAVNQIRNRHIIDVFSFGQLNDGRHFYVMDLLDGAPLDRWLKQHGRMDVASALQLLAPIAEALDLAHAAGIVHRDLKPQNIFLAWDSSGETVPKLLDFGMAKLLGESPVHTVSGTPIGTPLYMSPEQARGEKVDHRSDVYALGVLCYELLVGRLPFTGDTTVAVLMAHIIQTPQAPSELSGELSPLLDAPLLRMLEKDPVKRPSSAGGAIAALHAAAQAAGYSLTTGALRLPRPQPLVSDERRQDAPDTIEDLVATERDARSAASAGTSRSTPLWPFGLGLVVAGAALGFFVLRAPATSNEEPQPPASAAEPRAAAAAAGPSTLGAADLVPPSSASAAAPSSQTAAGAAVSPGAPLTPTARASGGRTSAPSPKPALPKNDKAGAARIPTDLENPF